MRCPFCHHLHTDVKDSRLTEDEKVVRRRRLCNNCAMRFTTFERVLLQDIYVIKRTGVKKKFDREKLKKSIDTAVRKRPITENMVGDIVENIVRKLELGNATEVSSKQIGAMILEELSDIDQVAYIRFASVYKDFSSVQDFVNFIGTIKKKSSK